MFTHLTCTEFELVPSLSKDCDCDRLRGENLVVKQHIIIKNIILQVFTLFSSPTVAFGFDRLSPLDDFSMKVSFKYQLTVKMAPYSFCIHGRVIS